MGFVGFDPEGPSAPEWDSWDSTRLGGPIGAHSGVRPNNIMIIMIILIIASTHPSTASWILMRRATVRNTEHGLLGYFSTHHIAGTLRSEPQRQTLSSYSTAVPTRSYPKSERIIVCHTSPVYKVVTLHIRAFTRHQTPSRTPHFHCRRTAACQLLALLGRRATQSSLEHGRSRRGHAVLSAGHRLELHFFRSLSLFQALFPPSLPLSSLFFYTIFFLYVGPIPQNTPPYL